MSHETRVNPPRRIPWPALTAGLLLAVLAGVVWFAGPLLGQPAGGAMGQFSRPASAAPEIEGITAWLNGQPHAIADLRGQVVLLDFWTYT